MIKVSNFIYYEHLEDYEKQVDNAKKYEELRKKLLDSKLITDSEWNEYQKLKNVEKKYDKALELLQEYNMPCEIDDFMEHNSDYCMDNCSVDEEVYKKCWDKFIEWKLGDGNGTN